MRSRPGRILRTHVMRPTWHFVTQEAIRWLLELTAPCVHRRMAVYNRHLELDPPTMTRGAKIFERALRDRQFLTRSELGERLRTGGPRGERPAAGAPRDARRARRRHLQRTAPRQAVHLRTDRRACARGAPAGPRRVARRAGAPLPEESRTGDGSRLRVVVRAPHRRCQARLRGVPRRERGGRRPDLLECGVAGLRLAARGGGVPAADLRRVSRRLSRPCGGSARPIRDASITSSSGQSVIFQHAVVIDGLVAGTWRTFRRSRDVEVTVTPLRRLKLDERRALVSAGERYQRYLETPVELKID